MNFGLLGHGVSKQAMILGTVILAVIVGLYSNLNLKDQARIQQLKREFNQVYPDRIVKDVISGEGWSDYVEYYVYFIESSDTKEHKTKWAMSYSRKADRWGVSYRSAGFQ